MLISWISCLNSDVWKAATARLAYNLDFELEKKYPVHNDILSIKCKRNYKWSTFSNYIKVLFIIMWSGPRYYQRASLLNISRLSTPVCQLTSLF